MAKLHCPCPSMLSGERGPILERICTTIADCLKEDDVYLVSGVYTDYEVRFEDNTSWFSLDHVAGVWDGIMEFDIELMVNDIGIWSKRFSEETISCFDSGYLDGSHGFMWETTACDPRPVEAYKEQLRSESSFDEEDGWGDGADLEQFAGYKFGMGSTEGFIEDFCAGDKEGDDKASTEEETFADGDGSVRYGKELGYIQPCIVPDNIGRIRVVALKYQGNVIAFRFKTDAGAFDMGKSVAAKYGLGGFKTETFITLESVNGLLMSSSERKNQVCVPDVSDCQEDCDKLIRALFGT